MAVRLAGIFAGRADRGAHRGRPAASADGVRGESAFIASLLVTAAATMYPYLLPGFPAGRSAGGISVVSAAPSPVATGTALTATILGSCIVVAYSLLVARRMRGKVGAED